MHFGEYELSPSLISLSPLHTTHPKIFQHSPVRSSNWCYPTFNLVMCRSLGFASTPADSQKTHVLQSRPLRTRFRFGSASQMLNLANKSNSQVHYAKGTPSQLSLLRPLAGRRVQGLFHSFIQGSFHLSLTVLVRYRSLGCI